MAKESIHDQMIYAFMQTDQMCPEMPWSGCFTGENAARADGTYTQLFRNIWPQRCYLGLRCSSVCRTTADVLSIRYLPPCAVYAVF